MSHLPFMGAGLPREAACNAAGRSPSAEVAA